jgi:hypothetical protein
MSSQIQITGETKVKSLTGVLVGTSGVVSSLNIDGSLGIPQLDVNGKILVSQLPNSVMEYKGTWDASTNTPTLANGTGNQGDVYLCSVAGTVNFGAGAISFVVSDQVIYSGSIWQKASGTSGTVTSVAASITGNSLGITGSPITTAGTLAFAFAGTNLQYINGAGNLTTFPTLISSIGLSMPSAFSVANSPLTANGTIAVTGAGYPSQYIRGDGTLADFPTSGGGGSSVSYYLNGGTSQGTIGGVTYYEMSKTADTGTGVDFPKTGDGLIVSFLTDANDPAQLNIPAGNWNYEIYASMSSNGGTPQLYAELYVYNGTTFTLIATSSNEILYDGINLNLYTFAMTVPSTTLALTDRLAIKLYATNSGGKTTTVHTQDSHLCQIITTFSTGITALNGLTAQVQYFATGTSGTDFAISSSTATHTFNLPTASATNRGALSSANWSTFNSKQDAISLTTTGSSGSSTFSSNTLNVPTYTLSGLGGQPLATNLTSLSGLTYVSTAFVKMTASGTFALDTTAYGTGSVTSVAALTLGTSGTDLSSTVATSTTTPVITLNVPTASATNRGALSSADWSTFNGKESVLTFSSPLVRTTNTISIPAATTSVNGYLTSTDWTTFNNKLSTATAASTYVPYTGATSSVALGTYSLSAANSSYNYVSFNNTAVAAPTITGYSSLTFIANASYLNMNIKRADGQTSSLCFPNDGLTHQYNLPSTDGTLALTSQLTSGTVTSVGLSSATSGVTIGSTPITTSGTITIAIATATTSQNGLLSSTDWTTFNNKTSNTGTVTSVATSAPLTGGTITTSGTIGITQATTSANGYLSSTDWNTFNGKFTLPSLTSGSVLFSNGSTIAQDNANFFWDDVNNRLGIGTATPEQILHIVGASAIVYIDGNSSGTQTSSTLRLRTGGFNVGNFRYNVATDNIEISNISAGGSVTSGAVKIYGTGGSTTGLTIAAAGAATFTSSVNVQNFLTVSSASTLLAPTSGKSIEMVYRTDGANDYAFIQAYDRTAGAYKRLDLNSTITILPSSNVGIGTTSPSDFIDAGLGLAIINTSGRSGLTLGSTQGTADEILGRLSFTNTNSTNAGSKRLAYISGVRGSTNNSAYLEFGTADNALGTERMRITSGGDIYMGSSTITTANVSMYWEKGSGVLTQVFPYSSGTKTIQEYYRQSGSSIGSITYNGTVTAYNSTSDYRLKEDLKDYNALNVISQLKTYDFKWKNTDVRDYGMMAHELQEVLPSYVSGEKDAINKDGSIKAQGVDYSKIVPILIKAVQELSKQNEELSNRLIKLENK